jgi:hypothetical protein
MRRITVVLAMAALAAIAALVIVPTTSKHTLPRVYASAGCTDATLAGSYAFIQPAGFTAPHSGTKAKEVPWQFVGVETFDGAGNTSVNYTVAVNGAISTNQTGAGTYSVNSDCSGSLSFTSGDAAGYAANLAISDGGAEVFAISTNPGNTGTVVEKRQ